MKQWIFLLSLLITLGAFSYTSYRIYRIFKLLKPAFPIKDIGQRINLTLAVALGQSKIFRFPLAGILHALVFWGFLVICVGSIEMVIDGLSGIERSLAPLGLLYDIISGSGDIFSYIVTLSIIIFLIRRAFLHLPRFSGQEIKKKSKWDAYLALSMILLLMLSLSGMNIAYYSMHPGSYEGVFPISKYLAGIFGEHNHTWHELFWWTHILLIFLFANILPYSKHFHVFMSIPNVFLSRIGSLTYMGKMDRVIEEVKLMMDPNLAFAAPAADAAPARFGVKDSDDVTWKAYLDSLSCTECGRCTSVCPANITGKKLSPRKMMVDLRARMKVKGSSLLKAAPLDDGRSLLRDYISEEELWACTTCNACAMECPINIDQPSLILEMRRYLVMEEGIAPAALNIMFRNIENNGAPWQYSPEDRLLWAENLEANA
jgi:heterodisulfide reductase subunit C/nitrate reductase gamma subunit